jgi:hypothetical protein
MSDLETAAPITDYLCLLRTEDHPVCGYGWEQQPCPGCGEPCWWPPQAAVARLPRLCIPCLEERTGERIGRGE